MCLATRRADHETDFSGQWKEYDVLFRPDSPVTILRLDLSAKPTRIEIAWIRLCRADGSVLREWDFGRPQDARP